VTFYGTQEDARKDGFRPCKRCRPDGLTADAENSVIIAKACRSIEQSESTPSLAELAKAANLSPSYFHRVFKQITGVTPKAYAAAHRAGRVRERLVKSASVTDAIYDGGFNSSGRFYEQSTAILGMTPRRFRAGGAHEELRFAVGQCSLGAILVASSEKGVASILIGDDPEALVRSLQDQFPRAALIGGSEDYEALVAQVVGLVETPGIGLNLPLDVRGTAFQQRVWQALREIPPGQTASYQDIARKIGSPRSVRAVAGACAANAIAVAIPCHRVVRSDGELSGYRWGIERKRALIDREAPA
jgi:AraC family transcriptional regulator of adaptative response/methylated-DNA-[protein]-cysteine methyltransferase